MTTRQEWPRFLSFNLWLASISISIKTYYSTREHSPPFYLTYVVVLHLWFLTELRRWIFLPISMPFKT